MKAFYKKIVLLTRDGLEVCLDVDSVGFLKKEDYPKYLKFFLFDFYKDGIPTCLKVYDINKAYNTKDNKYRYYEKTSYEEQTYVEVNVCSKK